VSPPRRILCATDLSACADRALDQALAWARETGAELQVLHVIVSPGERGGSAEPAIGMLEAGLALERLLERHAAGGEAIRAVDRGPAAAPVIVDRARKAKVDLIVVGTHGRRGFRSLLLGSVAEEVVRTAPCPVLAVPPRAVSGAAALPRLALVPLDFGPRAPAAVRYAKELVPAGNGRLVLLHVIEEAVVPDFYYPLGSSLFLHEPDARCRSAAALESLYWEAGGPDVPFEVQVVDGRAAADIARIADEIAADVIVMPTHGFATPDRLTLGSTTDKVLRSAPCPVLVHCTPRAGEARPLDRGATSRRATPVG